MSKTALICGISGQDGAYLAQFLLGKGYRVVGTSRDAQITSFSNLKRLGIQDRVSVESMSLNDFRSVLQAVAKVEPDEVYNLAGQSSVGLSFEQPVETMESISLGALNLLEVIRFLARPIRLYNACSGDSFGNTAKQGANESEPFRPRSPYAVSKATAYWVIANYRDAYGLYACSGLLFNHESPLRPERFVTKKVVMTAKRIADGSGEKLHLGNLSIHRDWGWAPEYVDAMWRMLQQDAADDYVIATGEAHSLESFVQAVFEAYNLDWRKHVISDPALFRPSDIAYGCGNPAKADKQLGWHAQYHMHDVVRMLVDAEQSKGVGH